MSSNKQIYVILTRTNTILSNLIGFFSKSKYTHASLSLDKNLNSMFSFGRRQTFNPFIGCFRRECLDEGIYALHKELPGIVIELTVTDEEYKLVSEIIGNFVTNSDNYKYNYIGLLNSFFCIETNFEDRFLCSEFVYYVLYKSKLCDLGIPGNLIKPQDLLKIKGKVLYEGDLIQYNYTIKRMRGYVEAIA